MNQTNFLLQVSPINLLVKSITTGSSCFRRSSIMSVPLQFAHRQS
jgi:hypothetical protein